MPQVQQVSKDLRGTMVAPDLLALRGLQETTVASDLLALRALQGTTVVSDLLAPRDLQGTMEQTEPMVRTARHRPSKTSP